MLQKQELSRSDLSGLNPFDSSEVADFRLSFAISCWKEGGEQSKEEALKFVEGAIEACPQNPLYHIAKGNLLREGFDNLASSVGCYRNALIASPQSVETIMPIIVEATAALIERKGPSSIPKSIIDIQVLLEKRLYSEAFVGAQIYMNGQIERANVAHQSNAPIQFDRWALQLMRVACHTSEHASTYVDFLVSLHGLGETDLLYDRDWLPPSNPEGAVLQIRNRLERAA
jgi:hypothetical protein